MADLQFLRQVRIFRNVTDEDLEKIQRIVRERDFRPGELLMKQGTASDALFIIVDGRVKVYTEEEGKEQVLAFLGPGDVAGEMASLTGEMRNANVVAMRDTQALAISQENFDIYLASSPAIIREIAILMAERRAAATPGMQLVRPGRVYTVFSPRGGSGKTTLAVNLAVEFAQQHPEQAALMDLCLTFGHCALALNLVPKSSLAAVSEGLLTTLDQESLGYYFVQHSSTLKLIAGANRPEEGETVDGARIKTIMDMMRKVYVVTVIDTPCDFSETTIAALEVADKVLLLCAPDLATLRDVRETQRIFSDLIHLPKQKICYVMNHVSAYAAVSKDQFEQALEQEMQIEIPFGGDVPAKVAVRGEALVQTSPGSNVAKAISKIARELEAEVTPTAAPARRGLFGRG